MVVGLVAGVIPALNIAGFQPLQAIQQLKNVRLFSRIGLRKALVTVQFSLSLVFILAVIIVLKQQNHVLNADLGQNIENVLNVPLEGISYDQFSQRVSQVKGVESVSSTSVAMLTGENHDEMARFGEHNDSFEVAQSFVSQNFMKNMGMVLVAEKLRGRQSDTRRAVCHRERNRRQTHGLRNATGGAWQIYRIGRCAFVNHRCGKGFSPPKHLVFAHQALCFAQ